MGILWAFGFHGMNPIFDDYYSICSNAQNIWLCDMFEIQAMFTRYLGFLGSIYFILGWYHAAAHDCI